MNGLDIKNRETHLLHVTSGAFYQSSNINTYLLHNLLQILFARTWIFPYRTPLEPFFWVFMFWGAIWLMYCYQVSISGLGRTERLFTYYILHWSSSWTRLLVCMTSQNLLVLTSHWGGLGECRHTMEFNLHSMHGRIISSSLTLHTSWHV